MSSQGHAQVTVEILDFDNTHLDQTSPDYKCTSSDRSRNTPTVM